MLPPFSVVIPCFNEAARIGETLRLTLDYLTVSAPESELIVVNDGSTDATAAIAREGLKDAKIQTRLLEYFPNRGKGAAVRSGLLVAREPIGLFFDAANNLFPSIPLPATEVSKKALTFTEQNMKAALDHAKKVAQANDLKEVMKFQTDFLRSQFANFGEQMRVIGEVMSAAKDAPKD